MVNIKLTNYLTIACTGTWNGSVPFRVPNNIFSGKHFSTHMDSFTTKPSTAPPSVTKVTIKSSSTAPLSVTKVTTKSSSSNNNASPGPVAPVSGTLLIFHY